MTKGGETPRLKRKASQEQAGSRKKHDAGKQLLFGGKGKQTLNIIQGTMTPRLRDGNSSIKLTGTAASTPVGAKFKGQGHAEGTAVGGKTVMSGSPTKLPGTVTPRLRYGNSSSKLTGTAASTPVGAKFKGQGHAEGTK